MSKKNSAGRSAHVGVTCHYPSGDRLLSLAKGSRARTLRMDMKVTCNLPPKLLPKPEDRSGKRPAAAYRTTVPGIRVRGSERRQPRWQQPLRLCAVAEATRATESAVEPVKQVEPKSEIRKHELGSMLYINSTEFDFQYQISDEPGVLLLITLLWFNW